MGKLNIIKAIGLTRVYSQFDVDTVALEDIHLDIKEGEFLCIMGPSGCGKSTLLNLLGLLDLPTSGKLYFMGEEVSTAPSRRRAYLRRMHLGFVFQNFNLINELTVYENVELPLVYQGVPQPLRKRKVESILERLQIAHKQRYFPQQVSGGQQQRIAVARAMVAQPDIVLADEPTGNLDSARGQNVMEMLLELNREGKTILMVTHSLKAADYANRILHLFDGHVINENVNQVSR